MININYQAFNTYTYNNDKKFNTYTYNNEIYRTSLSSLININNEAFNTFTYNNDQSFLIHTHIIIYIELPLLMQFDLLMYHSQKSRI